MGDDKQKVDEGQHSSSRPLAIQAAPPAAALPPVENQPRQPSNLHGLLKFAMDANQAEEPSNNPPVQPLDEEVSLRHQFI